MFLPFLISFVLINIMINILKKRLIFVSLCYFLLLMFSSHVHALVNFSGTYEGPHSFNASQCLNPAFNGPRNDILNITIIQDGNNIKGKGGFGETLTGTVDRSGNFVATVKHSNGGQSRFSGTFTPSQMSFTETTIIPGPDGCNISGSAILHKISGAILASAPHIQQSRQIVRATNSLISQHLATELASTFTFTPRFDNTLGASADQEKNSALSFWGTTSLTEIHEDSSSVASFDTDIYQFVGGFDKQLGKLFVGTALTYAYGETEQEGQDSNSQVFGVTPYLAYQLTDFMFVSGLAGYNYTYVKDESFGDNSDVHDYIIESNLNFYKMFMDAIIIKSRLGTRFHHTYVGSTNKPLDATTDELIWLGDFELGYHFQNKLTTYVGTYYEYFDRESSANHSKEHDGILYMRGGFDYPISGKLTLGAKVQADLNDEDTDIITGSITLRLAM